MKKPAGTILVAAVLVLFALSVFLFFRYQSTHAAYTETKAAEETVRGQYNEAITAIAEIQDNLNAIELEENDVQLLSRELEARSVSQSRKEQIVGRIDDLRESVERSKEKIRQLETNLRENRAKVADLEKVVVGLKESLAQKEKSIELLTARVEGLRVQVAGLETEVRQNKETILAREQTIAAQEQTIAVQVQTIEEKRRELSTIYYIVGTKKDLRQKGIIEDRGGFIGIGKTAQLSARFNEGLFTPMDTDHERLIRVPSTKLRVLSPQTRTSYSVRLLENQAELMILDRAEFRRVKYLVIMVA